MKRTWILSALVMFGCGGAQNEETTVIEAQLPAAPLDTEESAARRAFEALASIRSSGPDFANWRPTSVVRLDDTMAVLDDSHAFIWEEATWRHVELPGPAPFRVGSMNPPTLHVKADGHRAVFAGPSAPGAESIGLFQLTRGGVEPLGVLPDWVAACRAFVASGTHLYVVASDEPREREGTVLHAEEGATSADWQPLTFNFPSNGPDQEMLMTSEGALLLNHAEDCEVLRLPSEGPSFEPTTLFSTPREGLCQIRVTQGLTPRRIVVTSRAITIFENGERREVDWPVNCVPFERGEDYDGYDELSPSVREERERDNMARLSSPGLVALRPLLFERFHTEGDVQRDQHSMTIALSSAFHREEQGRWVALPEEDGERTLFFAAMHAAALSRPSWSPPVNWGPFRIAVARGDWLGETPVPTLRAWRADGPELIVSAFPSRSRRR